MIRNWKLRIVCFIIVLGLLLWLFFDPPSREGLRHSVLSFLFLFGLACLLLIAPESEMYPDSLARSFTRLTRIGDGVGIFSTWVCSTLMVGPLLPSFFSVFYIQFFGTKEITSSWRSPLFFDFCGIVCGIFSLYLILELPFGYRCGILKNKMRCIWTYFGKDVRVRDFNNVRIIEYALMTEGGGGPVVTIEYDGGPEGRRKKRLKFRNLYKLSREEFGDILSEFLGEPERRTVVPTSWGGTPRLVSDA